MDTACSKSWTQYGNSPSADACPNDSGSFHAGGTSFVESGWSGNSESNLMGCALAIAFKSDASSVQPEDFIVMSVQENCVRQRDTTFAIPANLPACPNGECTCAWFWQGKNSANEMYMNGFRCNVEGGVATASYPKPALPRKNAINGPTQPMYWANDRSNLDYTPEWATKPSYNSAWGWKNGAQTEAFSGLGGGDAPAPAPVNSTANANPGPTSTGNQWENSQPTTGWEEEAQSTRSTRRHGGGRHRSSSAAQGSPTWYVHAANPTALTGEADAGSEGSQGGEYAGAGENAPRPAGCKRNLRSRHRRAAKL